MSRSVVLPCVVALLANTGVYVAWAESPTNRLFKLLASEGANLAMLEETASGLTAADVRAAEATGSLVQVRGSGGVSALMLTAAFNADPEVVQVLVAAGADVTARDADGWSALMYAAAHNRNAGVTRLLLAAGADPHTRNARRRTPLMEAAENNRNPEVIRVLLSAGADLAERDGDFAMTPLMFAAWANESAAVVRELLAAGADVHARDRDGWTALMHAAVYNIHQDSPAVVGALLAAGSNVDTVDDVEGYTALMWAANHGEVPAVVHALLDAGADPSVRGANGETAATLMATNEPLRRSSAFRRLTEADS